MLQITTQILFCYNRNQVSFGPPAEALSEENLRIAFGHIGHIHRSKIIN